MAGAPIDLRGIAHYVRANDAAALVDALSSLDEPARRALADGVYAIYRAAARGESIPIPSSADAGAQGVGDRLRDAVAGALSTSSADSTQLGVEAIAGLAVLGCCRFDRVRRIRFYDTYRGREYIVRVLRDRQPDWRDRWLEHCLDARNVPLVDWQTARVLVVDGVCAVPESPGYARAMVMALAQWWPHQGTPFTPISTQLRHNADLLDTTVWKLFEVDTGAFEADWRQRGDELPPDYENWSDALQALAGDGTLDRARMLDAALDAPWKLDNSNAQSNVCRFFTALRPTTEERAARAERMLELLRHRNGVVVGFALDQLTLLRDAKQVTEAQLLSRLPPVFDLRPKKQPIAALKLLQPVERLLPEHTTKVLAILAVALPHPAKDVQALATALLARCRATASDEVDTLLTRFAADLPPSLRRELPSVPGVIAGDDARDDSDGDGVAPPQPAPLSILDTRPCATAEALVPIQDIQALIDLAAQLIERVDRPADIERLLDGISRLCDQRPADFRTRTAALEARLQARRDGSFDHGVLAWGAPPELEHLLAAWLGTTTPLLGRSSFYWMRWHGAARALRARLRALITRVGNGVAAPLLSAPTHDGGWVHPMSLVTRARVLQQREIALPAQDFELALLRLAPDDRTLAHQAAQEITGMAGRVLRFALGGDDRPGGADRDASPWWVAAAHARAPEGDRSEWLAPLRLPQDWPGMQAPATLQWQSSVRQQQRYRNGPTIDLAQLTQRWSPPLPEHRVQPAQDFRWYVGPRGALRWFRDNALDALRSARRWVLRTHDKRRSGQWGGFLAFTAVAQHEPSTVQVPWCIELLGWTTPLDLSTHLAEGAQAMLLRIDDDTGYGGATAPWIMRLLAQETLFREPAMLALGIALVSRSTVTRGIATEVLVRAIDDGRATVRLVDGRHPDPPLHEVLARLADGSWFKRNRLAAALADIPRISPVHAQYTAYTIEGFLLTRGKVAHEDLPLLEQLLEARAGTRTQPAPALMPLLAVHTGNSKTARVAKNITAMFVSTR